MSQENFWKLIEDKGGFAGDELVVFAACRSTGKTQQTQQIVDCLFDVAPTGGDDETTTLKILKGRE